MVKVCEERLGRGRGKRVGKGRGKRACCGDESSSVDRKE